MRTVTDPTPTDLAAEARELHLHKERYDACAHCRDPWPCLTIRLADALDAQAADLAERDREFARAIKQVGDSTEQLVNENAKLRAEADRREAQQ